MIRESGYAKKAALIADGHIFVACRSIIPYPLSISSAGPAIGSKSITFEFNKHRIKLGITRNKNVQFHLQKNSDTFSIIKNGVTYIDDVKIISNAYHAPEQLFMNLQVKCIYDCLFCEQNENSSNIHRYFNSSNLFAFLKRALNNPSIQSAAFTSGIYPDITAVNKELCSAINIVKKLRSDLPIGVEPYIYGPNNIDMLKNAGADEIKINLQIPDKHLFRSLCPNMNYSHILNMLDHAIEIFGRGKVCSNILFGLGESDESVLEAVEELALRGVTPTLRMVRLNQNISEKIKNKLGKKPMYVNAHRILNLGYEHKNILIKYGLTPTSFHTMCHRCCCCDLTPFIDF
jgi:biotin synthase-related radical SAM superfamily protein